MKKKISKYAILCIILIIVVFIGESVMGAFAEKKYRSQRDQETEIVAWDLGISQKIWDCDVTITDVEWRDEAEVEIPEDQQFMIVHYQVDGKNLEALAIGTLAYLNVNGQYISASDYVSDMEFYKKPTAYSQYMDKEQGELVFIVPEAVEQFTFLIQEYDDNVIPQQLKGSMLKYEPYKGPELTHQYEIIIAK